MNKDLKKLKREENIGFLIGGLKFLIVFIILILIARR